MLIVKVTSSFNIFASDCYLFLFCCIIFCLKFSYLLYEYVWSSFLIEKYNHVETIHGGFMVGVLLTGKMAVSMSNFLGKLLDEK